MESVRETQRESFREMQKESSIETHRERVFRERDTEGACPPSSGMLLLSEEIPCTSSTL